MNNSDILFIYDAQMCNPNGDPDEENRPRMDYATQRNLVSDVRLKRYIRDYLQEKGHELYVSRNSAGETVDASTRVQTLLNQDAGKKLQAEDLKRLRAQLIDVRMFGGIITLKGQSNAFTGPVQFNWGYSLNKVYLLDSQTITSHFSSGKDKEQGSIGKDYRVKYSLIAFHGTVSGHSAEATDFTKADLQLLDEALIRSIPLQATRSKIGQTPLLYLRVEYHSPDYILGDLRKWIQANPRDGKKAEEVFETQDMALNLNPLVDYLGKEKENIQQIHLWKSPLLRLEGALDGLPAVKFWANR